MEQFDSITTDISSDKAGASDALNVKYLKAGSAVGPMEGCNLEYGFSNAGARSQIVAMTPPGTPTPPGALIGVIGPSSGGNKVEGMNIFMPGSRSALDFSSLGGGNEDETDNGRFSLWVFALGASSPISVTISPADFYGDTDGTTPISGSAGNGREYAPGTEVTISVPASADGCDFVRWARFDYNTDGSVSQSTSTDLSQTFEMNSDILFVAGYELLGAGINRYLWVHGLRLVSSSPENTFTYFEAPITVSVADISDPPLQDGTGPPFQRLYADGAAFSVTAPATYGGYNFLYWFYDYDFSNPVPGVGQDLTMGADINLYYVYDSTGVPPTPDDNLRPLTFPVFDTSTHYFRWLVIGDFTMALGDNIYDQGANADVIGLAIDDSGNLIYFDNGSGQVGYYSLDVFNKTLNWFDSVTVSSGGAMNQGGLSYVQNSSKIIYVPLSGKVGVLTVNPPWDLTTTVIQSIRVWDSTDGTETTVSDAGELGLLNTLFDLLTNPDNTNTLSADTRWATTPLGIVLADFRSGYIGSAYEPNLRCVLYARDLVSGAVNWYQDMEAYLPAFSFDFVSPACDFAICSDGNAVAVKHTKKGSDNNWRTHLFTFDPMSGTIIATQQSVAEMFARYVTRTGYGAPLADRSGNFFVARNTNLLLDPDVSSFSIFKIRASDLSILKTSPSTLFHGGAYLEPELCLTDDYLFVTWSSTGATYDRLTRFDHNLLNALTISGNIRMGPDCGRYQGGVAALAQEIFETP